MTLHTALRNVFDELSEDAILAKARLADRFMARLSGVAAADRRLRAESARRRGRTVRRRGADHHRPAVRRGLAEGLRLEGPLPTDTLMVQARNGRFDAVVAMYHDQGHIALKLLGMHRAVNVTLGLPIIRTSVAHGTAFDIAWQRPGGDRQHDRGAAGGEPIGGQGVGGSRATQALVEVAPAKRSLK